MSDQQVDKGGAVSFSELPKNEQINNQENSQQHDILLQAQKINNARNSQDSTSLQMIQDYNKEKQPPQVPDQAQLPKQPNQLTVNNLVQDDKEQQQLLEDLNNQQLQIQNMKKQQQETLQQHDGPSSAEHKRVFSEEKDITDQGHKTHHFYSQSFTSNKKTLKRKMRAFKQIQETPLEQHLNQLRSIQKNNDDRTADNTTDMQDQDTSTKINQQNSISYINDMYPDNIDDETEVFHVQNQTLVNRSDNNFLDSINYDDEKSVKQSKLQKVMDYYKMARQQNKSSDQKYRNNKRKLIQQLMSNNSNEISVNKNLASQQLLSEDQREVKAQQMYQLPSKKPKSKHKKKRSQHEHKSAGKLLNHTLYGQYKPNPHVRDVYKDSIQTNNKNETHNKGEKETKNNNLTQASDNLLASLDADKQNTQYLLPEVNEFIDQHKPKTATQKNSTRNINYKQAQEDKNTVSVEPQSVNYLSVQRFRDRRQNHNASELSQRSRSVSQSPKAYHTHFTNLQAQHCSTCLRDDPKESKSNNQETNFELAQKKKKTPVNKILKEKDFISHFNPRNGAPQNNQLISNYQEWHQNQVEQKKLLEQQQANQSIDPKRLKRTFTGYQAMQNDLAKTPNKIKSGIQLQSNYTITKNGHTSVKKDPNCEINSSLTKEMIRAAHQRRQVNLLMAQNKNNDNDNYASQNSQTTDLHLHRRLNRGKNNSTQNMDYQNPANAPPSIKNNYLSVQKQRTQENQPAKTCVTQNDQNINNNLPSIHISQSMNSSMDSRTFANNGGIVPQQQHQHHQRKASKVATNSSNNNSETHKSQPYKTNVNGKIFCLTDNQKQQHPNMVVDPQSFEWDHHGRRHPRSIKDIDKLDYSIGDLKMQRGTYAVGQNNKWYRKNMNLNQDINYHQPANKIELNLNNPNSNKQTQSVEHLNSSQQKQVNTQSSGDQKLEQEKKSSTPKRIDNKTVEFTVQANQTITLEIQTGEHDINNITCTPFEGQQQFQQQQSVINKNHSPINSYMRPRQFSRKSEESPTRHLMRHLVNNEIEIKEGTALLINKKELLTEGGIKGKISKIGVGFGTGRHTSGRGQISPKDFRKQRRNSQLNQSQPGQRPKFYPVITSLKPPIMFQRKCRSPKCRSLHRRRSIALSAIAHSECQNMISVKDKCEEVIEADLESLHKSSAAVAVPIVFPPFKIKISRESMANTERILSDNIPQATQTDPIIDESKSMLPEPVSIKKPFEPINFAKLYNDGQEVINQEPKKSVQAEQIYLSQLEEQEIASKDWAQTELYKFVHQETFKGLQEQGLMNANGDNDLTQQIHSQQNTARTNQTDEYQQKLIQSRMIRELQNLNPNNKNILNQQEAEYAQSLIKKKSTTLSHEQQLQEYYKRAKITIEVLTQNMIRANTSNASLFQNYKEIKYKNVVKLLIRCIKLYRARIDVIRILKMIIEVEETLKIKSNVYRVLLDKSHDNLSQTHKNLVQDCLLLLSKTLTMVSHFQTENHLYTGKFYFGMKPYQDTLLKWGSIIGGFLLYKNLDSPSLESNGLLNMQHVEEDNQIQDYEQWYQMAIKFTGPLELPPEQDPQFSNRRNISHKVPPFVRQVTRTNVEGGAFDEQSKSNITERTLHDLSVQNLQEQTNRTAAINKQQVSIVPKGTRPKYLFQTLNSETSSQGTNNRYACQMINYEQEPVRTDIQSQIENVNIGDNQLESYEHKNSTEKGQNDSLPVAEMLEKDDSDINKMTIVQGCVLSQDADENQRHLFGSPHVIENRSQVSSDFTTKVNYGVLKNKLGEEGRFMNRSRERVSSAAIGDKQRQPIQFTSAPDNGATILTSPKQMLEDDDGTQGADDVHSSPVKKRVNQNIGETLSGGIQVTLEDEPDISMIKELQNETSQLIQTDTNQLDESKAEQNLQNKE